MLDFRRHTYRRTSSFSPNWLPLRRRRAIPNVIPVKADADVSTAPTYTEVKRLNLHADIGELARLSEWIEDCTREGIPPDVSHAIQLCLEEAVANVIMHGERRE